MNAWLHGKVCVISGLSDCVPQADRVNTWLHGKVCMISGLSDSVRHKLTGAEKQRQNYIQELITTEEIYNEDMSIVLEVSFIRRECLQGRGGVCLVPLWCCHKGLNPHLPGCSALSAQPCLT